MRKIVILNGNHLCHNPRVIKEAGALAAAGYDVEVLGAWFDEALATRDRALAAKQAFRYTPLFELFPGSTRSLGATAMRARKWAGMRAVRWFGIETSEALGYGSARILAEARRRAADLYIAHSEPTLWVAAQLAQEGRRVGVDMEDWFSEDYLRAGRARRLIRHLEATMLCSSAHATCTSHAMSEALAAAYQCRPPLVIYNGFAWQDRMHMDGLAKDRRHRSVRSLHWFSQTVGPARGLEDLFAALPRLATPVEVHIRGVSSGANRHWFERSVPQGWRDRIFLHPLVANDELPSRIAEHDVGLALERDEPKNRDVTVSNKILQYLHAGLPVVATSTAGQREVSGAAPRAVRLYRPGDASGLAQEVNELLADDGALASARSAALEAAHGVFAWERIAPLLVSSVELAARAGR